MKKARSFFIYIFTITLALVVSGCLPTAVAPVANDKIEVKEYTVQQVKKPRPTFKKKGALYSRQGPSLFADKKDLQIGDIVKIKITETLKSSSTNARSTTKNNKMDMDGGTLESPPPPPPKYDEEGNEIPQEINEPEVITQIKKLLGYTFQSENQTNFSGNANTKLDEKFETSISAVIEQIYQNGNYFIKGSKLLLIEDQQQKLLISGVIRPYDISPDNTIDSTQVADLKIVFVKDGDESEAIKVPWGTKIINKGWPF